MEQPEPRMKELKVTVPIDLYLKLLRLKLLTGRTIASTLEAALRAHFEDLEKLQPPSQALNQDEAPPNRAPNRA